MEFHEVGDLLAGDAPFADGNFQILSIKHINYRLQ